MLPPMLPLSAVPITSQQDPVRQRPDIPPVVPVQESSNESTIDMQKRDAEQSALLLREEQQRQQQKQRRREREAEAEDDSQAHSAVPGDELNADNTVPVAPLIEGAPRQGLWVDVEV
ncbi:aspartate-semialdehyde dehydrogenase [Pseudomonas sp. LD120]|uniref:aspartate-semialdehyde dehydrogenase n=1 Tax=Pseudomonas sp. LD120 TaxID=485751 RepID=UPI0013588E7E|nr:aspartate-semialdehyde dehydrogenase [Pseudomonas sp. LD120]KAF0863307.1 aspartate-semialdehyde dehydrogenase [Pseudomonas sp. LD120]